VSCVLFVKMGKSDGMALVLFCSVCQNGRKYGYSSGPVLLDQTFWLSVFQINWGRL